MPHDGGAISQRSRMRTQIQGCGAHIVDEPRIDEVFLALFQIRFVARVMIVIRRDDDITFRGEQLCVAPRERTQSMLIMRQEIPALLQQLY
jgi:hypothetical protein